ncbi:ricin-type beta-trefoil lectin domain protein [Streptomyces sp. NPDC101455]|uniref:ricin-type beta-trefoil lectin domain protein n=1 Tax=Streptomyces sp. NPDC101455 TaxID=3366142 RepID=UPI00380AE7A4
MAGLATALAIPAAGLVAIAAAPAHAAGSTYYVDCSQSSSGSGTQTSPWNSLAQVNATTFQPGDKILLARGTTCTGTLAPQGSGASSAPIVIDTYGTGAKPIVAGGGASDAVALTNQQYWEIRNLEVTNHGATAANRRGVHIVLNDYGTGTYYRLTNLTVHDVNGDGTKDLQGSAGIQFDVLGSSVPSKFDDVVVNGNDVYTVDRSGINMSSSWKCRASMGWLSPCTSGVTTYYPWTGFVVKNNTVHDIGGDGIVMQYTQNGLAENNVAYDTSARSYGSNAAIWDWNADNVTFQYNEAYQTQKLSDNNDGMAWDADFGTDGTLYQYNYSHDNVGGMAMFCGCAGGTSSTTNATFRYNVSQNDGSQVLRGYGVKNGWFYNNTIYEAAGSTANIVNSNSNSYISYVNNLVVNHGSGGYTYSPSTMTFGYNIMYGSQTGVPSGQINADPLLVSPGSGGTGIGSVDGYQIKAGSPAIGAGRVIPGGNGGSDYWGDPVPSVCAPDIGADQLSTPDDASCPIVQNGGFETGALAPWTAWNTASVVTGAAHSGTYAVQVGPAKASAEQVITVKPNTTYRLTGWAKTGTTGEQVNIGVKDYGGNEAVAAITSTAYTKGTVTFHTGSSNTTADIYCYEPTGTSTSSCDDFSVQVWSGAITGVASGRCANAPSTTDGTQLVLQDCSSGSTAQTFTSVSDGTLRVAGKCLTAASSASLAPITISTCTGSSGQSWTYDPVSKKLSPYSGMCMDANSGGTANGTKLILYACTGQSNQQWQLP